MKWYNIIFGNLLLLFITTSHASQSPFPVPSRAAFAKVMINHYHLQPNYVNSIMQKIRLRPKVITQIKNPAEKKSWDWYKKYFLTQKRIQAGVRYWHQHEHMLNRARHQFGVNPSIIVAIAGIETFYGTHQGHNNTLNALASLAFHYPKRAAFFQKELASYFLLNQKIPLGHVKSSYAGAIGIPQFMPSTYLHYAVSANPQHQPQLMSNHNDAIFSIANYLKQHGWQRNQFIVVPAITKQKPDQKWFFKKPTKTTSWYHSRNIKPEWPLEPKQPVFLIKLNTRHESPYWLALPNFYCLLRYNPRINYAMAVYSLSRALQHEMDHVRRSA